MRKVVVVETGHGMAGFYGAEAEIHETDLPLEEFAKQWIAEKDFNYQPGDLESSMGYTGSKWNLHLCGDEESWYFIEVQQS